MSDQGNSLIKTPRQLITVVILAFLVPVVGIILLATFVVSSSTGGAGAPEALSDKAIAARMQPVGVVAVAAAGATKTLQTAEAVYAAACSACHTAGVAGAPRTGDVAAWAPRIKQGLDVLVKHAVEGFKAMPPKGGNPNLDSIEVARAVVLMANQSGAKFKEPALPAPTSVATGSVPTAPAPVAIPAIPPPPAVAAAAGAKGSTAKPDGAKVYAAGCNVCHATGVAGAPKLGDKAAWSPRLNQGIDALTASVIKGKGAMPPRGAVAGASDADLRAAVEYMISSVK